VTTAAVLSILLLMTIGSWFSLLTDSVVIAFVN
jgi:hypothetical protein